MKQFNMWWKENSWRFTHRERSPDRIAKEAWEAALKWSLSFSEYDSKDMIRNTIKKELEDK